MSKKALYNKIDRKELKKQLEESKEPRVTLSFYKYHHIDNPKLFRDHLYDLFNQAEVFGRIYVANEGVNAQISVPEAKFDLFKEKLSEVDFLQGVRLNIAIEDDGKSFYKLKIKIRQKIVADGLNDGTFDVTDKGTHVDAATFNELTDRPETVVVDMRNHYESEVGYFENAYLPDADTFREALPIVEEELEDKKENPIVMYCTGGIRCEKASAYFKSKGFKNVYQLDGGIIEYAREVENKQLRNKFRGKNFVFDDRLGERISDEIVSNCHQCGASCDTHINCANDACHLLLIQCENCAKKYNECCSEKCSDFIALPQEEQDKLKPTTVFNGTIAGKSRYRGLK